MRIGNHFIDKDNLFFIVEEGNANNGDLNKAFHMIDLAAKSGADAVKFQILDSNKLISDKEQKLSYPVLLNRATGEIKTREEPIFKNDPHVTLSEEEELDQSLQLLPEKVPSDLVAVKNPYSVLPVPLS